MRRNHRWQTPPCEQTGAGYFKSTVIVGGYYRCIYDSSIQRWKKYNYTCPSGQEFSDAVKKCVPIAS
ncbi:chitin-binding domain-containing protein [Pseudomonas petroselini]|uniref:chitin-binding domain-containing protein n=1 Tax=Pseudomonas petroselini TaxID=2899822 RepID=UPI003CC642B6